MAYIIPDVYARRLDVLNRGLSGYNTDWAIPVFEQVGGLTDRTWLESGSASQLCMNRSMYPSCVC